MCRKKFYMARWPGFLTGGKGELIYKQGENAFALFEKRADAQKCLLKIFLTSGFTDVKEEESGEETIVLASGGTAFRGQTGFIETIRLMDSESIEGFGIAVEMTANELKLIEKLF